MKISNPSERVRKVKEDYPSNHQKFSDITAREAGRRGGQSTLEHKGVEFFRQIGQKGGQRTAELYRELLAEFGKHGGRPNRPTLGESLGERDLQ
jgi:general stress protein YciG